MPPTQDPNLLYVKNNATGQYGTINVADYNPSKYTSVAPAEALAQANSKTTPQQAPPSNTLASQATFPATQSDNPLEIAGHVIGNLPSSAVNFGKNVLDFLNPLANIGRAQNLATGLAANEANPVGAPSVGDVLKEVPGQAYKMLVPQFLQHIASGDLGKASETIQNDPIGQIAPLLMLARQGAEQGGNGAQFDNMISKVAAPITKQTAAIGAGAGNIAVGGGRFLAGQLTGISPTTIEKIIADPAQFSKDAQAQVTRPALADRISTAIQERQAALDETGNEYGGIRTGTSPIPVSPDYLTQLIKETTGLTTDTKGNLQTSGSAAVRAPSDVAALQSKLASVWQPEFQKGYLTPHEFLNLRADLARLANYDGGIGKSPALQNVSSIMRGKLNSDLRPGVPGLEQLDTKFAPEQTALEQLSRGLVDKNGNLTDAAVNRIANATGKGKDPQLARLETLSPGITDHIKILKAVEDLQNSREVKTGTYLRAGALGAGIMTLNPYLITSAVMSIPEIAVPLLRGAGYSTQTIGRVLKTLGVNPAISKLAPVAKKAATIGAIGAPTAQNQQDMPTEGNSQVP